MQIAKNAFSKSLVTLALACAALGAHAESDLNTASGANMSAAARLDFRVTVPRILFLQVGAGSFADDTTVSLVDWTMTAAQLNTPGAIAATTGGAVSARVLGNGGNINFTANGVAGGPVAAGVGAIPWTNFTAAVSGGTLPHPAIGNGVAGAASALTAVAGIVNQAATWTFSYANAAPIAAGVYTGQVTYTATMP